MELLVAIAFGAIAALIARGVNRSRQRRLSAGLIANGWSQNQDGRTWTQGRVHLERHRIAAWWTARIALPNLGARGRLVIVSRHEGRAKDEAEADQGLILTPIGRPELDAQMVVLSDAPDFVRGMLMAETVVRALLPVLSLGDHVSINAEGVGVLRVQIGTDDARVLRVGPAVTALADALAENLNARPVPLAANLGSRALAGASAEGSPFAISARDR